jgi:hypothetical protein
MMSLSLRAKEKIDKKEVKTLKKIKTFFLSS